MGVSAGGSAGVSAGVTRTEGGVSQKQVGGCHTPTFHLSPSFLVFVVLDRHDRSAPAEREMTGATPPF